MIDTHDANIPILHHFDASPFAEKVRLAMGLKDLRWRSVEIPMVMPKPNLTALTGGYRKTPVLQIGADIYCDTQRIAMELEQRHPAPTLFPDGTSALALALAQWSDAAFFRPGAALSMGTNSEIPDDLLQDRQAFFSFFDFARLDADIPHFFAQYRAQLQLVEDMLADGRPFLLGDRPGWVDILAYFPLWMGRGNVAATGALVEPLPALRHWEARVAALGHGQRSELPDVQALELAAASAPRSEPLRSPDARPEDLALGDAVSVAPVDYGAVPVAGLLHRLTHYEVAVRREQPGLGELVVHFPRIGYDVRRQP